MRLTSKTAKTLAASLLVATASLGLAACGGSEAGDTKPSSESTMMSDDAMTDKDGAMSDKDGAMTDKAMDDVTMSDGK